MRLQVLAAVISLTLLAGCATQKPSGRMEDVIESRATVTAIDVPQRLVTLQDVKGEQIVVEVSDRVKRLDEVKVGDQVVVTYVEALSLTLKKEGKEIPARNTKSDAVRSAEGAKPGGAVAEHTVVTADVIAIDQKTHMVTLRGPKQEVDLYVADPAQLKLIKVGDQIEAEYTQALAVTVEPAKK